jgi:hypothetical protein
MIKIVRHGKGDQTKHCKNLHLMHCKNYCNKNRIRITLEEE